jgi:predicted kinase
MKIQVLVGMIASGKSTYAKNAARSGLLCVNDDAIVNMLHGDDYSLYSTALKPLYKTLENTAISTVLAMGKTVVVDRGLNVSLEGRQRWLALAKSFDVPCEAVVFDHDGVTTHAERRAKSDSRGHDIEYWKRVAFIHNSVYKMPTVEEGFDKIHRISFDEITAGKVIQ